MEEKTQKSDEKADEILNKSQSKNIKPKLIMDDVTRKKQEEIMEFCKKNSVNEEGHKGIFDKNMVDEILDKGQAESVWFYLFTEFFTNDNQMISKRRVCAFFHYDMKNAWNLLSIFYTYELLGASEVITNKGGKRIKRGYMRMLNLDRWAMLYEDYKLKISKKQTQGEKNE